MYVARFFQHCHVQMLYTAMIVCRLFVCLTMPIYDGCLESRSDMLVCFVVPPSSYYWLAYLVS